MFGEGKLSRTQVKQLEELCGTKTFTNLHDSLHQNQEKWAHMIDHPNAESVVPEIGSPDPHRPDNDITKEMKKLAVLRIIRPDRFIALVRMFVSRVLGDKILNTGDLDLMRIVERESQAKSPLLLVSAPGFDASYKVEMLAKQANKKYTSVAIGSPEAF